MDDLIILYGTLFLMLAAACGWLVWNVMRASAPGADASAQGLHEALRAEKRRLDDELAAGAVTPELYASLLEDLRRRALEETGAAESLDALHAARSAEAERRSSSTCPICSSYTKVVCPPAMMAAVLSDPAETCISI